MTTNLQPLATRILSATTLLLASLLGVAEGAEPYIPTDDSEVLETLPRSLISGRNEMRELRQQLAAEPSNAELASKVAGRYLQMGNVEGDPRFYGYARAAIEHWWEASDAPPVILAQRAKLKEKDHNYNAALADLELLIQQQPQNVQAWTDRGNIYRVQGKYGQAKSTSDTMAEFAGSAQTLLSRLPIMAVTGEAEAAYSEIAKIRPAIEERFPDLAPWMITIQANAATALGKTKQAEQHLQAGLELAPGNKNLLRNYADLLLDGERNQEVISLLKDHTSDNGVLLRAAIAAKHAGKEKQAAQWKTQLENRFEELRLRGSQPHGRFESRYELELNDNPQRALEIALANWQQQKEARDTRNVLEAAVVAADPAAAQRVIEFLRKHQTQDVVLEKLTQKLESI